MKFMGHRKKMNASISLLNDIWDKIFQDDCETIASSYYEKLASRIIYMIGGYCEIERKTMACTIAGNIIMKIKKGVFNKYLKGKYSEAVLRSIEYKTIKQEISTITRKPPYYKEKVKINKKINKENNNKLKKWDDKEEENLFDEYVDPFVNPVNISLEFQVPEDSIYQEEKIIVDDLIKKIDGRQAVILRLLLEGYQLEEIANNYNMTESNVVDEKYKILEKLGYKVTGKKSEKGKARWNITSSQNK